MATCWHECLKCGALHSHQIASLEAPLDDYFLPCAMCVGDVVAEIMRADMKSVHSSATAIDEHRCEEATTGTQDQGLEPGAAFEMARISRYSELEVSPVPEGEASL